MGKIILNSKNLTKSYQNGDRRLVVLDRINLKLEAGTITTIIGESGSGKSTLLNVLSSLDTFDSGKLLIENEDIKSLNEKKLSSFRNEKIGFIFQFHHLLKELNALENVMMPSLIARTSRKKALEEAKHWLNEVGLSHRLTHRPSELSGGEQQRVSLARALMNHPLLLLADEPTGNLDQETSQEIHDLLTRVNEEYNTALLIVTHNPELAQLMPRQVRMRNGHLVDQSK